MLILYTKNNCPYCEKVKSAFEQKNLQYEERNIENEDFLEEARSKGAKTMPFLVNPDTGVAMGESSDIIDYVEEEFE